METVEPELDALERELAGEVTPEPHPFLALVLARMKTNPEEFSPDNSQWRAMIDQSKQYLTAEEKKALKTAERDVGLDHLHRKLMERLLADKTPTPSQAFAAFNTTDLGSSTATRPRDIYTTVPTTTGTHIATTATSRGHQRITPDGYYEIHDGYGWKRLKLEDGYV